MVVGDAACFRIGGQPGSEEGMCRAVEPAEPILRTEAVEKGGLFTFRTRIISTGSRDWR